jgi:cell surface protein SprA
LELSDFAEIKKDGRPVIEQIKHARIWLTDIGETVNSKRKRIQIADFKVVGNRWEKDGIRSLADSFIVLPDTLGPRFALGVISNKTDPAKYNPPIQPNVQNEIAEKEQSLLVKYDDIEAGMGFRVLKRFAGTGMDLSTTYGDLSFFVHTDQLDPDLEYFFRLGFDSVSYYEVNVPLTSQFFSGGNWARVVVELSALTGLKLLPADSVVTGTTRDLADPNIVYEIRMVGGPSLFNVRFLFAGLRNKSDRTVSGELWINDIFLGNRSRNIDSAQRFAGSVSMGNILYLSGSWTRTGPDYVPFGQKRGSATDTRSISLNAKTNVEYFVPMFGFSIPFTGSYARNTNAPKYVPNSDTEIKSKAMQDSLTSESVARGFSTTITRSGSKNPLLVYTFDKLKANYSMSQAMQKTPSSADTTLTMNGTLDYSITFGTKHRVRLFKNFGIRYWPNSFSYRINATRTEGTRYRAVAGGFVPDPPIWDAGLTNSGSIAYVPLPSLTSSFRIQTERDLKLPHEVLGVDVGQEVNRSHSFQANYKPPPIWLVRAFSPDFNYTTGYREDSSPNVQKPGDPYGVRNVSASRDISVKLGFNLGGYLGKLFGAVGLLDEKAKRVEEQRARGAETSSERQPAPEEVGGEVKPGATPGVKPGVKPEEAGSPATTDSTAAQPKRKADPLTAVRKVADVLSSIRKINASFQQGEQNSYSRIPGAPSLAYQFGLTTGSGVVYQGSTYDDPERISEALRMSMDSGVQVTRNIDVAGRFGRSTGTTTFRASEVQTSSTTWPDLSVSWKGLETFGPFRGLFNSASATMTYNKSRQETGRSGAVETIRESANLTPSLVFQWKNAIQSAVGVQYGKDLSDTRGSVTENSNLSVALDMKYTFNPGKALSLPLPFLKNRTLKSRLDTSVSAGYSKTGGRRSAGEPGRFVTVPGTTQIKLSPRVAYNFTTALNGSFFIDYSRSHSDASDQTTTIVRVGLTATFTF